MFSCKNEEVTAIKPNEIHLASTFLQQKDSILFQQWSRKNSIRVVIRNFTPDSLINLLKVEKFNSGIDLVICDNLYDIMLLNKAKVLQANKTEQFSTYDSRSYNYFALGINPYIFSSTSDSLPIPKTYDELQENKFRCALSREEEIPMLSALLSRLDRQKTYNWIKTYNENKDELSGTFTLKYYSELEKNEKCVFPGQRISGTMYNLITAGIIHQTANYKTTLSLISFIVEPSNNSKFCSQTGVINLSNPDNIRLYRENQKKLLQYYSMIERILDKIK